MQTSTKLYCCNQFGDKGKIQALVNELTKLVGNAYREGYIRDGEPFRTSQAKKQLDKILKEVV